MSTQPNSTADIRHRDLSRGRCLICALSVFFVMLSSGCANLRLPAIDPSGRRILSPLPTTTGLALPGAAGERPSLLGRVGQNLRGFQWPKPAFTDPAAPPECLVPTPVAPTLAAPPSNEPCVPSAACNGQCKDGPPAVLFGQETQIRDLLQLPNRGKRGCILLTPQKIVAPVGGEVVLLTGICGDDGYLQVGEPLEWMLTPDSVGTMIQVGDDDPGLLHRLTRVAKAKKSDGSFARGVTSTKRTLITRGNLDPRDDVQLEKGQTWMTLSSPSEGTSRVTVLAPESECWDNRKATATIYWVDATPHFPSPQLVASGTPVQLTTRVYRAENRLPAEGWRVRYEILDPSLAAFASSGNSVAEIPVDANGNATAELLPFDGTSGSTPVDIQVIRPGGKTDNIPTLTLDRGRSHVTWNAPQLKIKVAAPEVASFNVPVNVLAKVYNPGNQPAKDVRVTMEIPPGVSATSDDGFAQVLDRAIIWDIGEIPPGIQLDLSAQVTAKSPSKMTFEARGADNLYAAGEARIDVYRPALIVDVQPERERYEAGEPIKYNIVVENTGDRALQDVELVAVGDSAMLHEERGKQAVRKPKEDGPLQPGEKWIVDTVFVPTEPGQRCLEVTATAFGQQRAENRSCVIVINPTPPTPAMTAKLAGRDKAAVGERRLYRGRVTNTGQVSLKDVRATMTYDPQLRLSGATAQGLDRSRLGKYMIVWDLPGLAPGQSQVLEAEFDVIQSNPRAQLILTAQSAEGAAANDSFVIDLVDGPAPATGRPAPNAPPFGAGGSGDGSSTNGAGSNAPGPVGGDLQPTPIIPGGPAPIPDTNNGGIRVPGSGGATGPGGNTLPGGLPPVPKSDKIQLSIAGHDNPARVGAPIRYTVRVVNDSDQIDNQISLRFKLPDGVKVERVTQRRDPRLGQYRNQAGVINLADIPSLRPNESIDYELVLSSNQPQTFDLRIESASQRTREPQSATTTTTVIQ